MHTLTLVVPLTQGEKRKWHYWEWEECCTKCVDWYNTLNGVWDQVTFTKCEKECVVGNFFNTCQINRHISSTKKAKSLHQICFWNGFQPHTPCQIQWRWLHLIPHWVYCISEHTLCNIPVPFSSPTSVCPPYDIPCKSPVQSCCWVCLSGRCKKAFMMTPKSICSHTCYIASEYKFSKAGVKNITQKTFQVPCKLYTLVIFLAWTAIKSHIISLNGFTDIVQ